MRGLGGVSRGRKGERKELAIRAVEADRAVDRLRGPIRACHLQVHGADVELLTDRSCLLHQRPPHPAIPQRGPNKQVVNEGTPAAVFHAVAEGQHQVPGHLAIHLAQPHLPEPPGSQEGEKRGASAVWVEGISGLRVELLHQPEEVGEVVGVRLSHRHGHWLRLPYVVGGPPNEMPIPRQAAYSCPNTALTGSSLSAPWSA